MKSAYELTQIKLSRKYEALQKKFKIESQSGVDTDKTAKQIQAVSVQRLALYSAR